MGFSVFDFILIFSVDEMPIFVYTIVIVVAFAFVLRLALIFVLHLLGNSYSLLILYCY